jgi:hypothetical protein
MYFKGIEGKISSKYNIKIFIKIMWRFNDGFVNLKIIYLNYLITT